MSISAPVRGMPRKTSLRSGRYSLSVSATTVRTCNSPSSAFGNLSGDVTGSMVELFAGHNWRIGNFVVGAQVEGTVFSDVSLKMTGTGDNAQTTTVVQTTGGVTTTDVSSSTFAFSAEHNDQLRSNVGVIGRIGYLVTPDILLYGLGGLALGNFVHPDGDDRFGGKNNKWVAGYTAGAGGELRLSDHGLLRAEYRYLHFDVKRDTAGFELDVGRCRERLCSSTGRIATARQTSADFHLGKVGVVYRFWSRRSGGRHGGHSCFTRNRRQLGRLLLRRLFCRGRRRCEGELDGGRNTFSQVDSAGPDGQDQRDEAGNSAQRQPRGRYDGLDGRSVRRLQLAYRQFRGRRAGRGHRLQRRFAEVDRCQQPPSARDLCPDGCKRWRDHDGNDGRSRASTPASATISCGRTSG